jgi:hypothetical protein
MANNELTIVEKIKNNDLVITDGSEYRVPMSAIFGRGVLPKTESFGGLTLAENAERTDSAIENMRPLQNVWNHSHSQWDWKHLTMGFLSEFRNMKQIEAEMSRKRGALNEAKWRQIKNEIKIRKLEEKLGEVALPYWEEVDTKVKIMELKEGIAEGASYIEGAMKDVLALNEIYEQLKARISNFTEDDFEREESKSHLKRSLVQCIRDVRQHGVITKGEQEYMENIGVNPSKMQELLRQYVEDEKKSESFCTTALVAFVTNIADDMIDNRKVDVKRMACMGFEHDPTLGINYDKTVAGKE